MDTPGSTNVTGFLPQIRYPNVDLSVLGKKEVHLTGVKIFPSNCCNGFGNIAREYRSRETNVNFGKL